MKLEARNRHITRCYRAGHDREKLAKDFKLSKSRIANIAVENGAKRRGTPRTKGDQAERVYAFIQPDNKGPAAVAAAARGISVGQLASRIVNTALSEPGLLDNVLDDRGAG